MTTRFTFLALFLLAGLVLAQACKQKTHPKPKERYLYMSSNTPSSLQIPINIERKALLELVNTQMPEVLMEDDNFQGYGVSLSVRRFGDLSLAFRQNPDRKDAPGALHYEVPLDIVVSKKTLLTTLNAEGKLKLLFASSIEIDQDWTVQTSTKLESFEWVKSPELSFGPIHLPIDGLTSKLIARMEGQITAQIDAGIQQNADLKSALAPLYKQVAMPKILSDEYAGYLVANPEAIGLSQLAEDQGGMATTLELILRPELGLGAPPVMYPSALPKNSGVSHPTEGFELSIQSLLGYAEMKRVLAKALVDTTIRQAGKQATIKAVDLYGQDESLVIGVRLEGDFTGWAYLQGIPVFNANSQRMELRDISVNLDTRNILFTTLNFLFRNRIKKEVNKQMGDQIAAQLSSVKEEINKQLADQNSEEGIRVVGRADKVSIVESRVTAEGLSAEIRIGGNLAVRVSKIPVE